MIEKLRILNKSGKYDEVLSEIQKISDKNRHHFCEAAKAHAALDNYKDALENINEVIRLKGDWIGAVEIKISILYKLDKFDDILPAFFKLIDEVSEDENTQKHFSMIFNQILDYKIKNVLAILSEILLYYENKFGADDFYNFYMGIVNSNSGNLESSSEYFNSVADFSKFSHQASGGASFNFGHSLEVILNRKIQEPHKAITFGDRKPAHEGYESVLFTSSDDGYFCIFIDLLIGSISKNIKGKIFHIHLINPSEKTLATCKYLHDLYDFYNFSYEFDSDAQKIDFACSRFIRLEEVLQFYRRDVVVCDMDSCFVGDFNTNSVLAGADVAIKVDDNCSLSRFPWRNFIASFVTFKFGDKCLSVARDMRSYLTHFTKRRDFNYWYVDQTVLFCLLNYHAQKSNFTYRKMHKTSHIVLVPNAKLGSKADFARKMLASL
jgi:tetratricopeptide (TPR) repeat protein